MRLPRRPKAFDSDQFVFELKIDGWRSLAFIENGECRLVSRNGRVFPGFDNLRAELLRRVKVSCILDGEICCLDQNGRSAFYDLMFRREERECYFFAFDVLFIGGEDIRGLPLLERKARLKRIVPRKPSRLLYVDHVETRGLKLFEKVCLLDLEGIVAKRKTSRYIVAEKPSPHWIKVKNPTYLRLKDARSLSSERRFCLDSNPRPKQ